MVTIVGVVGRDGGFTAKVADQCVIVPTLRADTVTPHVEAFQAVIWHLLVSHPSLHCVPALCSMSGTQWDRIFPASDQRSHSFAL